MIKAIIFDCFGVLASEGWRPFKSKYLGDEPDKLDQATELSRQVNSGAIDFTTFIDRVSKLTGTSKEEVLQYTNHTLINDKLFNYIATELKPKYKIGLLSNSGTNWIDKLFSAEQKALFDTVVISFMVGEIKPLPKIYHLTAERLGVKPSECVFTDDQERHTIGAKQVGMQGIWYKDFEQFKSELEPLLK